MEFESVKCDRCGSLCPAYYSLSSKTKALWVQCKKCGNHAVLYQSGLNLPWKPSKSFIREVGKDEAMKLAKEAESNGGKITSRSDIRIPGANQPERSNPAKSGKAIFYCDAGTKNNGQFGKQKTIVVVTDEDRKILVEEWVGDKTNNEGELIAITSAAKIAPRESVVFSDSELAVKWVNLQYGTKIDRLKPLIYDAIMAVKKKNITVEWISREKNFAGHHIEEKYSL